MAEVNFPGFDPRESSGPLKVAPHSLEAEQSVLGGLMLDQEAWDKIADVISEGDFYRQDHRLIFRAIAKVFDANKPCDVVTVAEYLDGIKELANVGGIGYLNALAMNTPTAANIKAYADIVRERSVLRNLIRIGTDISNSAYDTEGRSSAELLDLAEQQVFSISDQHNKRGSGFVSIKELLKGAVDRIDMLYEQEDPYTGAPTGFSDLDEKTSGLQKSDLIIIAGRPSMGKCVEAGTQIVLEDGSVETIETLYQRRSARLLTLARDWRLRFTEPSLYVDDGRKPVFRVTTRLGRSIETTATHPYLTPRGWRPLGELAVGEKVAVPRRLPVFGRDSLRDCELKLLGYLLGDGSLTQSSPRFTNINSRIQQDFIDAVEAFGGLRATLVQHTDRTPEIRVAARETDIRHWRQHFADCLRGAIDAAGVSARQFALAIGASPVSVWNWVHARSMPGVEMLGRVAGYFPDAPLDEWLPQGRDGAAQNSRNALTRWLDRLGVYGKDAHGKFIPAPVFRLPRQELGLFINRLFATDGWASLLASGQGQLGYATVSERLARDLQHLLLRFGVIAKLRSRQVKYADRRHSAWQLDITDAESILSFAREIGIFGKEQALEAVVTAVQGKRRQSNCDLIPVEFWDELAEAKGDESWAQLARRAGIPGASNIHAGRRALSRSRLARLANALGDAALQNLAASDVYWDEIVAIEYTGYKQVYDLTIPDTHNFIANDVCVHNTTFAMNIAENAAIKHQVPVGVFSMEMPGEQLALRMMSSLGHIDQHRIRTGKLHDDDWPRLTSAVSLLAEAPIFIDDTPAMSPNELRARCRRLKREHNLGLVVIDYLQLMQSPGYGDNRVNEISDISRNLKALAKELSIPVIALSQLNRGLEQRPNKRPVMSDLRECVTGDTQVMLADGQQVPIATLVGKKPAVVAMSENGELISAVSDKVWCVGRKQVFKVVLASGRSLRGTAKHRLYSGKGWRKIGDLRAGDSLAILPEAGDMLSGGHQEYPDRPYLASLQIAGVMESAPISDRLRWDRIVSIEPAGEEEVYDLTVPGPASWLADSIVSHNSGAIEQDADVIIFIYRDEVYNEDSPDKGTAEIIIAKQRNGPIGTVRLTFLGKYTRFENFASENYNYEGYE